MFEDYTPFLDAVIEEHIRNGFRKANEGLVAVPEQFRKVIKQKIIWTRMEAQAALQNRRVDSGGGNRQASEVAAIEEEIVKSVKMFASLY